MFNSYSWAGANIDDIEIWASQRGEKMVDVTWRRKDINPYSKDPISYYETNSTMPESFWNTLTIRPDIDGTPIKVVKREPKVDPLKVKGNKE